MSGRQIKAAPLQLEAFQLNSCLMHENISGTTPGIGVELDFEIVKEENGGRFGLEVVLHINSQESACLLSGSVEAIGLFSFSDVSEVEQNMKLLVGNGLSIVYGMLRGIVYEKASSLPPSLRLLPTLDLVGLVQQKVSSQAAP